MNTLESILKDLYEIDPELKTHETELVPLLQKLLAENPGQAPTPAFVQKLRKELNVRAFAMQNGAVEHAVSYDAPSSLFQRFAYAFSGAALALVIGVPVTLQLANNAQTDFYANPEMAMEDGARNQAISDVDTPSPTANNPAYAIRPQSGGGGGDDKMAAGGLSLIAPWSPVKYRLEGDLPTLPTGEVTVLERTFGALNIPFSSIQNAFDDVSIDLSSFDGTTVESVSLSQKRPFGYMINVSMTDGSVSINQMWDQWPHPESTCQTEECYRSHQPKISDVPGDAVLIQISNAFLNDHDIDVSGYGAPVVDHVWRDQYNAMEDKRNAWVPESVRVIYPLLVDGEMVIEAMGEPAGLSIQVSIKHKRVSDAWGLTTYNFTREDHEAVSDRASIEKFLSQAGSQTPDAKTVTLSNPTMGLVRLYTYENNRSRELYVPALIFKITGVPADIGYYQQTIAVPLAKDLLDQAMPPIPIDPIPMPRPMEGGPAVDVPAEEPLR